MLPARFARSVLAVILIGGGLSACASDISLNSSMIRYAWLQAGPDNQYAARLVSKAATCPAISIDGITTPMNARGKRDADFPDLVCEKTVPAAASMIKVEGISLPAPRPDSQRIVIIGDTGCRIKSSVVQDCNDPADWPFAAIAAAAAKESPDAVLHVGDYFYREIECPKDRPGCAASPFGDNQATWEADWLKPASPLFAAAPLLLSRGNHETCARGWKGWMLYLSPGPYEPNCRKIDPPFLVTLGRKSGPDIAMIDSSEAEDIKIIPSKLDMLIAAIREIAPRFIRTTWVLSHKPIWGIYDVDEGTKTVNDAEVVKKEVPNGVVSNVTWVEALKATGIPKNMDLALGGHIHSFQANAFGPDHPGQIMMGVSGADLQEKPLRLIVGKNVGGAKLASAYGVTRYGYLIFDRNNSSGGPQWKGSLKTSAGERIAACSIDGRTPRCEARIN